MAIFKCKMCGGDIDVAQGKTVGECQYCGTTQTLPKMDDESRLNLYARANHFRRNNEYDKAIGLYERILEQDNTDAEAYWSLVLCKYGIVYVEDPATHKQIPTVNRAQFTSVVADENYKAALQYADSLQKAIYQQEAKYIDEIQKGILAISQNEEPFDVFICYKETDNNGRRTHDSVLANDLYHQLTQEGFKVFFSRITLEDKLGTAYEPYIFAALNSAKVMVVLGTRPEYFNAVWVKNEWSRYLSLVKNSKGQKILIPAYKDMDPYDLPEEFSHLQAQDMSKLGFMQDLIRGIKKLVVQGTATTHTVKETVVVSGASGEIAPLLKRGFMALEDKEWSKATSLFEHVLDIDMECADAYLGLAAANSQSNVFTSHKVFKDKYFQRAVQFEENTINKDKFKPIIQAGKDFLESGKMNFPSSTTKIGSAAFSGCENLTSITIPASVMSIDAGAFRECPSLRNIVVDENNANYKSIDGNLYSKDGKTLIMYAVGKTDASFTIPDIVTSIGLYAFWHCSSLTNITIPNSVTSIERGVFHSCTNLTTVIFGEGSNLTSIGEYAFYICKKLTNISIPSGLTSIGEAAFLGCISLTNITIPNSVTGIGERAFSDCTSLKSITIPNGIKEISEKMFYDCKGLTSITIPEGITSIGYCAFDGCKNLTYIKIPSSVTCISERAFNNCKNLTSVTFEKGSRLTHIARFAFSNSDRLSTSIPNSVTNIGDCAFSPLANAKKEKTGGCYIATAVYGSYDCPQVWTLRRYRDEVLGSTWYGRLFIKLYYAISPTLVKWFGKTKWFQKMWQGKLDCMVKKLNAKGFEDTPYQDKDWR